MKRLFITLAVAAAVVTGGAAVTTATASAATSVGWCDGVKSVRVGAGNDYVRQPYHRGTGSRNCTLAEGGSGAAVSELQRALKKCNFASGLTVDGDFGPNTKKAVANAQSRYRIGQDGIYGPESRVAFQWHVIYANGSPSGKCIHLN